MLKHCDNQI